MKRIILCILYLANITLVLLTIILPLMHVLGHDSFYMFLNSNLGLNIRSVLLFIIFSEWIYLIYIWSKFDKKPYRLLLLIFPVPADISKRN